jgi:hypothetical protein
MNENSIRYTQRRTIYFLTWARNKVLQTDSEGRIYGHIEFPFRTSFLEDQDLYGLYKTASTSPPIASHQIRLMCVENSDG